jgi:hypothetical protein
MKTILFYGCAIVLIIGVYVLTTRPSKYKPAGNQVIALTTEYQSTATPKPTNTLVPTATIDYQQTAIVAQGTADEARRVNAQATAQHEEILNQQMQATQVVEQQDFAKLSWTAEAVNTVIPLTATQQAVINTQIPRQQAIVSGQLTATKEAPAQARAMIDSQLQAKYGAVNYIVSMFAMGAISIFAIGLIVFLFVRVRDPKEQVPAEPIKPAIFEDMYKIDLGQGDYSIRKKHEVPCTHEQLTELSELVVNGEQTFGINRLENTSRTLSRDVLYQMRGFYLDNNLAVPAGAGQIALNDEGERFHQYWFDRHELPTEYKFMEAAQ